MARALIKEIKDAKKNYVLNGNFNLWQRTSALQTFGGQVTYHADRFAWAAGTITGTVKSEQMSKGVYSNSGILPGSIDNLQRYEVQTAQPSLGAIATAGRADSIASNNLNFTTTNYGLAGRGTFSVPSWSTQIKDL